jgi:hypothetical protein
MTVTASLPQIENCSDTAKVSIAHDKGVVTPPTPELVCPKITMKCPSSVVTGGDISCSADLSGGTEIRDPKYYWTVTPPRRIQGQGSPEISVNTTGLREKELTVRLRLPQFGRDCLASSNVSLEERNEAVVTPPTPQPVCPEITLRCPGSIVAGEDFPCSVDLLGGTAGAIPKYSWRVSAGNIIRGQGASRIEVSTSDVREKELNVILNLEGFGRSCGTSSRVQLQQRDDTTSNTTPTPTPTSAATPTPTPAATPTASATVAAMLTPSPGESVSPGVLTSNVDKSTPWFWILVALVAIGALAVFSMLLRKAVFGSYRELAPAPTSSEPTSAEVAEREQRFDAMILAAKKKQDDEVSCTVFAPHQAARGDGFLVQAFAHLEKQAPLLLEIAKQADIAAEERVSEKLGTIERGQELGFYLQMPGLDIDEPQQSLVWLGEITSVKFGVTVPEDFKPHSINCKLSVSLHNVPIGHIRFNFKIAAAPQPDESDAGLEAHKDFVRYKLAFISYASPDRTEVLKRVQMLDLAKIRYFQDLLSLEAGKQWEPLIYRYIDECDVFYLFWSTAAKNSKWVEKEVQRALKRKGDKVEAPPEIMPVPIEGPPPIEPPPYLASIHFDSKFLYFINPRDHSS